MGTVLMLSTQDLLPGPWMGGMFFGIMLGGSMQMPGLQTILVELTGKEIRGRLMAICMIVSNMTMGLGGFWSTCLLSMENGYLLGMGSGRAVFDVDFAGRSSAALADSATATQYATTNNLNLFATV